MCYIVFISHRLHWRYIKIALRKYVINPVIGSYISFRTPWGFASYQQIKVKYQFSDSYVMLLTTFCLAFDDF